MDLPDGQDFVLVKDDDLHGYDDELLPQPPEVLAGILKWLQHTDYLGEASEYGKHLSSHVVGTDLWIQETEAYRQWHDSPDHGVLWTKAIAGAGKSVFAAIITAQLARIENVPVLFFFFRQIVANNHHPQSLARDWIAMILKHSPSLQAKMKKHIDDRRALENISTNEFWQDLVRALASLPKVYCIVDALDEMDVDQEDFLKSLVALGKRKPSSLKLMMTSRPLPRIEVFLKDPSILQIRLEQLKVDKDISLYVDYRLRNRTDFDDSVRATINDSIGRKSQGSFLYARLMMDKIVDHKKQMVPKVEFLQRSLDWLPVTLEDMYNDMLLDHSLRSRVPQELQLTILQWVTHSSRPLRLLELAAMLDCQRDTGRVAKDTKAVVRAACGPLLEILEDETVSVIHHSFTEFLIDAKRRMGSESETAHPQFPVIDPVTTHSTMTLACLKYLTSGCMDDWKLKDTSQSGNELYFTLVSRPLQTQQAIRMRYPFFEYAKSNWYFHASKLDNIGVPLLEALGSFMTLGNHSFLSWLDMDWPGGIKESKMSPLHVASWAGMTSYVQHLLHMGMDSNGLDGRERTPLSWASARGHVDVVALLLQRVSQPDVDDCNGHKPLHYAALANHHEIVKLLLAAGVSPTTGKTRDPGRRCGNARSSIGDSPLMYCCNTGSIESVREMMPYLKREDLNQALCWAATSGKTEVVELLLASPDTSVDDPGYSATPLFLAASGHHFDIMRSLLRRGADPNRRSANINRNGGMHSVCSFANTAEDGSTPLHAICGASCRSSRTSDDDAAKKCFQLLLEAGCDINPNDVAGKTPLHYSVTQTRNLKPDNGLTKLLLEHGARVMDQDNTGNTPLHLVQLRHDPKAIIEELMAHGADLTKRNSNGQTPIHAMMESMNSGSIKSLVPYVSNWNVQDSHGNTPLHIVFSKSYNPELVFKDLMDAGADLGQRNRNGEGPIHVLREFSGTYIGKSKIVPELLKAGADLNMRDAEGRTVLLRFLLYNSNTGNKNCDPVEFFLEHGADIHSRDFEGNGPLHQVCKRTRSNSLVWSGFS
jgi:ankyrin repeat protein